MVSGNRQTPPNAGADGDNTTDVLQAKDVSKPDAVDLPVKYVLYSHISYGEEEDFSRFKEWENQSQAQSDSGVGAACTSSVASVPNYRVVGDLRPFLKELKNLLTDKKLKSPPTGADTPGILILFYARGYAECLEDIAEERRPTREEAMEEHSELRFAESVQGSLQRLFDDADLRLRVRVITALDLYDIFSRIETDYAQNLIQWFIGLQEETIRYDAPKIVEAIIRVRMIGSGAPVFRIDQDVLFRRFSEGDPGNAKLPSLALAEPIKTCVEAFHERVDNPRMAAFLFSGSYDSSLLGEPGGCQDFYAWSRAFATRCFPALCIVPEILQDALDAQKEANDRVKEAKKARKVAEQAALVAQKEADGKAKKTRKAAEQYAHDKAEEAIRAEQTAGNKWKAYVIDPRAVDPKMMCDFFGIETARKGGDIVANPDSQDAIGWLGANPLVSVISGALLCINDSAILDLPPFSNFNLNVSWIDDHLKYCLHRELRHFTTVSITTGSDLVRDARIDRVVVVKGREPPKNLAEYIMGNYLPTVLYGSVVDAWITPGPKEGRQPGRDKRRPERYCSRDDRIIKWRPEMLNSQQQDDWKRIPQSGPSRGLLPSKLQAVLGRGTAMSPLEARRFKRDLLEVALKRISAVRNAWYSLKSARQVTFALVWAIGENEVEIYVPGMTGKAVGLVRHGTPTGIELNLRHLNENVREDLMMLIEDAVTYIDMTLNWSKTVQLIRSIEPGTLKTDLFRNPKD
jgi:hypothetical protein